MKFLLTLAGVVALPAFASDLSTSDMTGMSFWIVTAAMLAATVFFFVERDRVHGKWKTSLSVAGLVTGVAFWHYLYMRGVWADTGTSPTVYRYIDWLITVPLQIIEFYLILKVCTNVSSGLFWKLLGASLVMLIAGFMGETGSAPANAAGIVGVIAWLYIIYEVFSGEAGKLNASSGNAAALPCINLLSALYVNARFNGSSYSFLACSNGNGLKTPMKTGMDRFFID